MFKIRSIFIVTDIALACYFGNCLLTNCVRREWNKGAWSLYICTYMDS